MIALKVLARLKFLRGTPFNIFGYTAERRLERQLIEDYFETVEELIANLDHANHPLAVQIAEIPESIRGYGHVKQQHIDDAETKKAALVATLRYPSQRAAAAE